METTEIEENPDRKTRRLCAQVSAYSPQELMECVDRESGFLIEFARNPTWNRPERLRKLRKSVTWRILRCKVSIGLWHQGWRLPSSLSDKITDFVLPAFLVEGMIRLSKGEPINWPVLIRNKNKAMRALARIEGVARSLGEKGILKEVERARKRKGLSTSRRPVAVSEMRKELPKLVTDTLSAGVGTTRRRRRHVHMFRKATFLVLHEQHRYTKSKASRIVAVIERTLCLSQLTPTRDAYGKSRKFDAVLKQVST